MPEPSHCSSCHVCISTLPCSHQNFTKWTSSLSGRESNNNDDQLVKGYVVQEPLISTPIEKEERENDLSKKAFKNAFKRLTKHLVKDISERHELGDEGKKWLKEMIEYNVQGGKMNRGLSVVHSLRALKGDRLSSHELEDATTLGWCIQWLQAFCCG